MKKIVNDRKYNVALYMKYHRGNLDELKKKEQTLIKFCEKNNYNIVKKYVDNETPGYPFFSNVMRNLLKEEDGSRCYERLIICDCEELTDCQAQLTAIYSVLLDECITIESLNQGIFDEDMLIGGTYFVNVLNKEELNRQKVYYDEEGKFRTIDEETNS